MKKKRTLKNFFKLILFIILMGVIVFYVYPHFISSDSSDIAKLGYSSDSIKEINKLKIASKVKNNEYSETLDKVLSDEYNKNYIDDYIKINYIKDDDFIELINELLEKSYNGDEINEIYKYMSVDDSEYLTEMEKKDELFDYVNVKYFKIKNLERYIAYDKKNDYSKENVVMYVNINMDKDFYSDIKIIDDTENTKILVNKYNALPAKFEAKNLVTFSDKYSYNSQKMNKVAAENIMKLIDDAREAGYTLLVVSGYRTETLQNTLYTNSVNKNGKTHADMYSARPGHSEHQTGLAVDISNIAGVLDGFEKYPVYNWVKENAHKYGFIERYPKGKEFITGYGYEPWHYRYVGTDVATTIYKENMTFEEYAVKYLGY